MIRIRAASVLTVLALVVTTIGLLAGSAGSASAEKAELGQQYDPGTPAHLDIRRIAVDNRQAVVKVSVKLARFAPRRTSAYAVLQNERHRRGPYYVVGWSQLTDDSIPKGKVLIKINRRGSATPVRCAGLKITINKKRGLIQASVPQRCLGSTAGTLLVSALSERPDGHDVDELGTLRVRRG